MTRPFSVLLVAFAVVCCSSSASLAFDDTPHETITAQALAPVRATISGTERGFTEWVIKYLQQSGASMDWEAWNVALIKPHYHFTNESLDSSSQRLITLRNEIIAELRRPLPGGADPGLIHLALEPHRKLGWALHALQDFYSHSNWIELQNHASPPPPPPFGESVMDKPAPLLQPCPESPHVLGPGAGGGLTTGYFVGFSLVREAIGCGELPYPGKCYHGNYSSSCRGINKDRYFDGPGLHQLAAIAATLATREYVEQIIAELQGDGRALSRLLGHRSFAAVIDTTGSMGFAIDGVKALIGDLAQRAQAGSLGSVPTEWVLVPFNDPDLGPVLVTDSISEFLAGVQALRSLGGGDCPEPTQRALLAGIDASLPNSDVYLFTDATANDVELTNLAITRAQAQNTTLSYAVDKSCSPVDPVYYRGARETGGEVFLIQPPEIDRLADVIEARMNGNLQTIMSVRGTLTGPPRMFDVPVDTSISRLIITAQLDRGLTASLFRPDGTPVSESDPDVKIVILDEILVGETYAGVRPIYTVTSPSSGVWRVDIGGAATWDTSNFSIAARANSPVALEAFRLVEPHPFSPGRYSPMPGLPLAGMSTLGLARVAQKPNGPAFRFVDAEGGTMQTLSLADDDPAVSPHFIGPVTAPSVPFGIVMTGTDAAGAPVRRQLATELRGQTVAVRLDLESAAMPVAAGASREYVFEITNLGSSGATFALSAATSAGTLEGLVPTLTVAPGASESASVTLHVPSTATEGQLIALSLTATNTSDASRYNTETVTVSVAYGDDEDGDSVSVTLDNCPDHSNGDQLDSDGDGVGDACDDVVDPPTPGEPDIVIEGPAVPIAIDPGVTVRLLFDSAGESQVTSRVTDTSAALGCVTVRIEQTNGVAVGTPDEVCDGEFMLPVTLPASGLYYLVIAVDNGAAGTADVTLRRAVDLPATTYHLHQEVSAFDSNRLQLMTTGPDAATSALQGIDLWDTSSNSSWIIRRFDAPAGTPGAITVIPAGSSIDMTMWMRKTANYGVMFPHVVLHLNYYAGPGSVFVCWVRIGPEEVTTTLQPFALTCDVPETVFIEPDDRFFFQVGIWLTQSPGRKRVKAELHVEGTENSSTDSRFSIPGPN